MSFRSQAIDSFGRTLISLKVQILLRSALVVMTSLLILAGCSLDSSGGSSGTSSAAPPSASTVTIQPIPYETWSSMMSEICFTPPIDSRSCVSGLLHHESRLLSVVSC
jgi:hypothetical protein